MYRCWKNMPRLLRDIILLVVAVFIIIILLMASGPDDTIERVMNVPKYFRGQLLQPITFSGPKNERQTAVVEAFKHAWKGYRTYAWGHDNLRPDSMQPDDWFGLGMTIIDSLSTMIIMDLKDEFEEAREWVKNEFHVNVDKTVSLFEVTIRVLGGLLSAYHLSGDVMFLKKSSELGERLYTCFHESPSGIPYPWINLQSLELRPDSTTSIAEAGTLGLEFRALGEALKNNTYVEAADKINDVIHRFEKFDGLVSADVYISSGVPGIGTVSVGGQIDSYYEYLLKQWIQIGKPEGHPLIEDYKRAVDGMLLHLVRETGDHKHVIIGELSTGVFNPKMEHLACFLPGTLLLGYKLGLPESHLKLAKELIESCYTTYMINPTHLAGENTYFDVEKPSGDIRELFGQDYNILRPEFVESLYYFWTLTGNSTYQEWGWNIFMAIEKYSKVENGYTSMQHVHSNKPRSLDKMETFFLAETLKYLYLLFSDDQTTVDLNEFVFNTEAHPLPVLR